MKTKRTRQQHGNGNPRLQVRVNHRMYGFVKDEAEANGISVSDWLRNLIQEEMQFVDESRD